jgi:hypothetical protein
MTPNNAKAWGRAGLLVILPLFAVFCFDFAAPLVALTGAVVLFLKHTSPWLAVLIASSAYWFYAVLGYRFSEHIDAITNPAPGMPRMPFPSALSFFFLHVLNAGRADAARKPGLTTRLFGPKTLLGRNPLLATAVTSWVPLSLVPSAAAGAAQLIYLGLRPHLGA